MRAFLGLGSNLGDRARNLAAAVAELERRGVRVLKRSHVYSTVPQPHSEHVQPDYYNQVIAVETDRSPRELLELCHEVEASLGRDRAKEERWGPRPIDVDILVIEGETIEEDGLVVPHPRLAERAFVIVPLNEIAPKLLVPGLGRVRDLHAALGRPRLTRAL
jgi:2-amino-4-hydroxy-6-hydroxymethyldihydropteridine diphosphokinase